MSDLGEAQPSVGGVAPGLLVLNSLMSQAEQAVGASETPPWPLHQLLPPGSCPVCVPVLTSSIMASDVEIEAK